MSKNLNNNLTITIATPDTIRSMKRGMGFLAIGLIGKILWDYFHKGSLEQEVDRLKERVKELEAKGE